jgi:hypothetical protein
MSGAICLRILLASQMFEDNLKPEHTLKIELHYPKNFIFRKNIATRTIYYT